MNTIRRWYWTVLGIQLVLSILCVALLLRWCAAAGFHPLMRWELWLLLCSLAVLFAVFLETSRRVRQSMRDDIEQLSQLTRYPEGMPASEEDEWKWSVNQIRKLWEQLQHSSDLKEQILADAVHEMRTPLTVMKSRIEGILEETIPLQPEQLLPLHDEVTRMSRLIYDLRQLSLAESGQLKLNYSWFPVADLVHKVMERFAADIEEKGICVLLDMQQVKIYGDLERLEQVFMNLIGNAVFYTPDNGEVVVKAKVDQYKLQVHIRNTGDGISLEHLPYIFERFYRADASRQRGSGGMGLGLAIAKHYVEAHDGWISVDSDLGNYTEFRFHMPLFPSS
ncbi:sensor histidine kinase [Marinicrinis lubricantis]|uniref:histidine kinase n=1 Tax=Marinicrinis lubricantis TaxID=2086470 RepID=A0ABW1ILA3_9BACL